MRRSGVKTCVTIGSAGLGLCLMALLATFAIPLTWTSYPRRSRGDLPDGRLRGPTDCGAASLYLVCKMTGKPQSLDLLRQAVRTSVLGSDMLTIKEAAERIGFTVVGERGSFRDLRDHLRRGRCNAILHVGTNHCIVAFGCDREGAIGIADPAGTVREYDERSFREAYLWEGIMLLLSEPGTALAGRAIPRHRWACSSRTRQSGDVLAQSARRSCLGVICRNQDVATPGRSWRVKLSQEWWFCAFPTLLVRVNVDRRNERSQPKASERSCQWLQG